MSSSATRMAKMRASSNNRFRLRSRPLRCELLEDRRMLSGSDVLETGEGGQLGNTPAEAEMPEQTLRVRVLDNTGREIRDWRYDQNAFLGFGAWQDFIYRRNPGDLFDISPNVYTGEFPLDVFNYTQDHDVGIHVQLFKDGASVESGVFYGGTDITFDIDQPGEYVVVASTTFQADVGYEIERLPFGQTPVPPSKPPTGVDERGQYEIFRTDWHSADFEYWHYKRYTYAVVSSTVTFVSPGENDFAVVTLLKDIDRLGDASGQDEPTLSTTIDIGPTAGTVTNEVADDVLKHAASEVTKELLNTFTPASYEAVVPAETSALTNLVFAMVTPEQETGGELLFDIGYGVTSSLVTAKLVATLGGPWGVVVAVVGGQVKNRIEEAYYLNSLKSDLVTATVDDLTIEVVSDAVDTTLYVLNRGTPIKSVSVVEFEEFGIPPGTGSASEIGFIESLDTGHYAMIENIPTSWLELTGQGVGPILVWDNELIHNQAIAADLSWELSRLERETILADTVLRTLSVSAPALTTVSLSLADNNGDSYGTGSFSRIYDAGTAVTLTAPLTNGNGDTFSHWSWAGTDYASRSLTVNMDGDQSVAAVYQPVGSLLRVAGRTSPTPIAVTLAPGGSFKTYSVPVENAGSGNETVSVTKSGGAASWTTFSETTFQLAPGDVHRHELRIGAPESAAVGTTSVTVFYNGVGLRFDIEVVSVHAPYVQNLQSTSTWIDGTPVSVLKNADYPDISIYNIQMNYSGGVSTYFSATELQANSATSVTLNMWMRKVNASSTNDSLQVFLNGRLAGEFTPSQVGTTGNLYYISGIDPRYLVDGTNTILFKPRVTSSSNTTVLWQVWDGLDGLGTSAKIYYGEDAWWKAGVDLPNSIWRGVDDGFLDYARIYSDVDQVSTSGRVYLYNYENKKSSVDSESLSSSDVGDRVYWTISKSELEEENYFVLKGDSSSETRVRLSGIQLEIKLLNNDPSITIAKSASVQTATVGESITVTVRAENTREGSATGYETDLFDATLPDGLRLVSGVLNVNDIGNIKYGDVETNTYTIVADAPGRYVLGSARIRYENLDGDQKNDESSPVAILITAGPLEVLQDIASPSLATGMKTVFSADVTYGGTIVEDATVLGVVERFDGASWVPEEECRLGWSPTAGKYVGESAPLLATGRYRAFVTADKDLYQSASAAPVEFIVTSARLAADVTTIEVPEEGSKSLRVTLTDDPLEPVSVTITREYGDTDIDVVPSTFTLDSSNWNTGVGVTVMAASDVDYVDGVAEFSLSTDRFGVIQLTVFEIEAPRPVSADFDSNNVVDGVDFLAWQRGYGTQAPNAAREDGDADNDLDVDGEDLAAWQSQYGEVSVDINRGPVAEFAFDETDGAVINAAGTNNGVNHGATRGVPGNQGSAFSFDGVDDYVSVNPLVKQEQGEYTISLWAKGKGVMASFKTPQYENYLGYDPDTYDRLYFHMGLLDNDSDIHVDTSALGDMSSAFHHYAVKATATTSTSHRVDIYLDGQLVGSRERNVTIPAWSFAEFGRTVHENNGYFQGIIDDIKIWDRPLDAAEIEALASEVGLDFGLVAYFPFDGDANEATGNSNDGITQGAVLTTDRFGQPDSAYYLSGGTHIEVPRSSAIEPTHELSISLWATLDYLSSGTIQNLILSKRLNTGEGFNSYIIGYNKAQDGAAFYLNSGEGTLSTEPLARQQWTHIAGVYDGSYLKLYQDGTLVSQVPHTGDLVYSNQPLWIGTTGQTDQFWNGSVDEVRIYDRALSDADVAALASDTILASNSGASLFAANAADFSDIEQVAADLANASLAFQQSYRPSPRTIWLETRQATTDVELPAIERARQPWTQVVQPSPLPAAERPSSSASDGDNYEPPTSELLSLIDELFADEESFAMP